MRAPDRNEDTGTIWAWLKRVLRRHPPPKAVIERPAPPADAELPETIAAAARVRQRANQALRYQTGNWVEDALRGVPPPRTSARRQKGMPS